jgi:hypothetical protein
MQLKEEVQRRIESLKVELESARKRAMQAKVEEETLSNDLAAYQRILDAESRRNGLTGSIPVTMSQPTTTATLDAREIEGDFNKAQLMRELIVENRATGSTPSSIMEALTRKGAECPPTYVYSALSRMKAKGLIEKRRGKYFPSESLLGDYAQTETASE